MFNKFSGRTVTFQLIDQLINSSSTRASQISFDAQIPQFALNDLLEHVDGDKDLLREMALIFLESVPKYKERIRCAIKNRDAPELEHASHALKGMAGNFLATATMQASQQLENMGCSRDFRNAEDDLRELERSIAERTMDVKRLTEE